MKTLSKSIRRPNKLENNPSKGYPEYHTFFLQGDFWIFLCFIQHCFICRPSDSTVSEDAGIEPWTVATSALAVRRSNHSARSHPQLG